MSSPITDQKAYRGVLGQYPTGVAIATIRTHDGRDRGLTINSFTSISLTPPLVMWCLDRGSEWSDDVTLGVPCGISILGAQQGELALRFARPMSNRFEGVETIRGASGALLIGGAIAQLETEITSAAVEGDHILVLAQVQAFTAHGGEPLVFHEGQFKRL